MINLVYNKGFNWHTFGNISVKGYIYDLNNNLILEKDVENYFKGIHNEEDFICLLQKINGNYAIIIENKKYIFAAVDRVRSIPLFYSDFEYYKELLISDDAYNIKEQLNARKLDKLSMREFKLTGYVSGNETLYEGIKQIGAGETLIFDKEKNLFKIIRYFEFRHNDSLNKDDDLLIKKLDDVYINVINRMIESLEGRTAVIPLSGGQDSRLVAIMLKRLGYENVICYTYGVKDNVESKISKKIADYLGYRWYFVEYNKKSWNDWYNSDEYKEYRIYSSNLSSIPCFQDFLAIKELEKLNIIPNDSVIIPGHTGDFIQGGHIPQEYVDKSVISRNEIIDSIFKGLYNKWKWEKDDYEAKELLIEKIEFVVGKVGDEESETAASIFQCLDWKERHSKFITNSIRVYEFFGYEWRLPLWDVEVIEYWKGIDIYNRIGRRLHYKYAKVTQERLLKDLNLYLPDEDNISIKNKMKIKIKKEYPRIYRMLLSLLRLKNKISRYYSDPLQWFGIVSWPNYFKFTIRASSIDSFIIHDYLLYINQENEDER